jgi:hypothetical protein
VSSPSGPKPQPNNVARKGLALAAAVAGPLGLLALYWLPPTENSWYPRCLLHTLTGLHCPGCGATRALHALLHGDVAQAAAYNLLFLLALPPLLVWGTQFWLSLWTGRPMPSWHLPPWSIRILIVLVFSFGVLRNLNFPPFDLLAPHPLSVPPAAEIDAP